MSIVRVDAQLILLGDAYDPEQAEALLLCLDQDEHLMPQRWGAETGLRDPYDRAQMVEALASYPNDLAPKLFRTQLPGKYEASFYGGPTLTTLTFEAKVQEPGEVEQFFQSMSRLAARVPLPLEWGHVTPKHDEAPPETALKEGGNFTHTSYYAKNGPYCIFPRTYFGSRLVALMEAGTAQVAATGFPWQLLPDGSIEFNLVPEPWAATPEDLKAAQQRAHLPLFATGIFCDESDEVDTIPGSRWQPPITRVRRKQK